MKAFTSVAVFILLSSAWTTTAASADLDKDFLTQIQPLFSQYCLSCHSTEKQKGELDLERFTSLKEAQNEPDIWKQIIEQVSLGEMPPADKVQPGSDERQRLISWAEALLDKVAEAHAGDPGPVVLRRLNNAEYTYTLRDLTGIPWLEPAKEFPVDSAAGEGFMNTGNALVMSPALLMKYLDAAKKITEHAVLLPDGFRFSDKTTRRDWAEEILAEIRALYARYTDPKGGEKVNLQGIVFDTNEGGRLPLERYIAATLVDREQLAKTGNFEKIARKHGLSARYLESLWGVLSGSNAPILMGEIRERWATAQPDDDAAAIAADIARWQKALWKFSSVGHIGKVGGPKAWMEPVDPLTSKQELRLKLPKGTNAQEVVVYLVASDLGDGNDQDVVIWEKPRLVKKGVADTLLRDTDALAPEQFGKTPDGTAIDPANLAARAPAVIEIRIPAALALDAELITTGVLDSSSGAEGTVQVQLTTTKPESQGRLSAGAVQSKESGAQWTSQRRDLVHSAPILVHEGSAARKRLEAEFDEFHRWFPAALCYPKIVPVDEVVTLTLAHREDDHLIRLMLDEKEAVRLNRLWREYEFVSQNALLQVDAFEQLWQYATQDADPSVFEPMRKPIAARAEAFRQSLRESESGQVNALVDFANQAYRRPLTGAEKQGLRALYENLREQELSHEEAFRHTLSRVFVAPAFLYKLEHPPVGEESAPISDWELVTRLSYFLWSSTPDVELRAHASSGRLRDPENFSQQIQRMLRHPRVNRLAREFATAWLHLYDFESLDEKSPRHFPEFADLRESMFQEAILFFTDLFRNDGSVLAVFDADHAYLNESLAKHYQIPGVSGPEFRRVDGTRKHSRGGVLTMAATLARQSGASRTSPILRGNWISEVLLGEKLPKPPKGVPPLPEDESGETLTVRQLVEKHTSDPRCANCHARIDGFGFALESFDAIGRTRTTDLGGRAIDTQAKLFDGTEVDGFHGLRDYLLTQKRDALVHQFCRKLLGFALGRSVLLSDRSLIAEMQQSLEQNDFRFSAAINTIVQSKQFREIRGKEQTSGH
ncbi:MAG: DUF1592 domain-containing protein [Limisphaerales bacterium]